MEGRDLCGRGAQWRTQEVVFYRRVERGSSRRKRISGTRAEVVRLNQPGLRVELANVQPRNTSPVARTAPWQGAKALRALAPFSPFLLPFPVVPRRGSYYLPVPPTRTSSPSSVLVVTVSLSPFRWLAPRKLFPVHVCRTPSVLAPDFFFFFFWRR